MQCCHWGRSGLRSAAGAGQRWRGPRETRGERSAGAARQNQKKKVDRAETENEGSIGVQRSRRDSVVDFEIVTEIQQQSLKKTTFCILVTWSHRHTVK
jgi:hypothetical protein